MDETEFFVCANKTDLSKQVVDLIEAKLWADHKGFQFFETSAANGKGINQLFDCIFENLVERHEKGVSKVQNNKIEYTMEQAEAILRIRNGRDNYEKLSLHRTATRDDINKAYKKLAILLHPDKNVAPGSDEAFKLLVNARTALLQNK